MTTINNLNTGESYRFDDEHAILCLHDLGVIPNDVTVSKSAEQIGEIKISFLPRQAGMGAHRLHLRLYQGTDGCKTPPDHSFFQSSPLV